jgi:SPP1 family predicted phage head-tail adaptor
MAETLNIRAGDIRWPITIQAPSTTQNSIGAPVTSWNTIFACRAKIESTQTATYKATTSDDTVTAQSTYIFTIRFPLGTNIATNMTILFNGQTYQINDLNNVLQRNRFLQLFCMVINGTA